MANEDYCGDERETRRKRMRELLKPISHERAQELANSYTKHTQDAVELTKKPRPDVQEDESVPSSSKYVSS